MCKKIEHVQKNRTCAKNGTCWYMCVCLSVQSSISSSSSSSLWLSKALRSKLHMYIDLSSGHQRAFLQTSIKSELLNTSCCFNGLWLAFQCTQYSSLLSLWFLLHSLPNLWSFHNIVSAYRNQVPEDEHQQLEFAGRIFNSDGFSLWSSMKSSTLTCKSAPHF